MHIVLDGIKKQTAGHEPGGLYGGRMMSRMWIELLDKVGR
jgi:hypothetical protein